MRKSCFVNKCHFIIKTRLTSIKRARRGDIKQRLIAVLHNIQTMRLIVKPRKLIVRSKKLNTRNKPQTMRNKRKTGTVLSTSKEPQDDMIPQETMICTPIAAEIMSAHYLTSGAVVLQLGCSYLPRANLYTCEKNNMFAERVCRVETR